MAGMSLDVNSPDPHDPDPAPDSVPDPTGARKRLFDAAVSAFAAKGFHGTTTRDIAAGAGMSPAALYVHHRSKEELLHLISVTGHGEVLAAVKAAIHSEEDPVASLERLVVDFARFHTDNPTVARIVNYELGALSPEHHAEVMAMRDAMDAAVRALVARGVKAGVFHTPEPAMTGAAILSLGVDIARWYEQEGGWTPDEVAEHYRLLALRMVGVPAGVAGVSPSCGP